MPDSVKATAQEGTVFLIGTASSRTQRTAAEATVADVAGVLSITNEVDVLGHS